MLLVNLDVHNFPLLRTMNPVPLYLQDLPDEGFVVATGADLRGVG